MSFAIQIQLNTSEPNKVQKDLSTLLTATGNLKQDTSIINPVFLVQADFASLVTANYLTVEAFGRSYFIQDMRLGVNGLVEVSAHVDVLTSFKEGLLVQSAIIDKQAYKPHWNLYLNDGSLQTYQNPKVITQPFPSGFNNIDLIFAVAGG